MRPGDRLVCAFIPPKSLGFNFKDWPLHITIVPWFRSEISTEELAHKLRLDLSKFDPIVVVMGESTNFGYNKNKEVNLVSLPSELMQLEKLVRKQIKSQKVWIADESTKIRRPFTPHVTAQKNHRLKLGDKFMCDELYIIEQYGDYKLVSAVVGLDND